MPQQVQQSETPPIPSTSVEVSPQQTPITSASSDLSTETAGTCSTAGSTQNSNMNDSLTQFLSTDQTIQDRIPSYGPSASCRVSGNAESLKNLASWLLTESLEKTSRQSYRRIYYFYKQFLQEYFPSTPVFPATLEHVTMFIAHCFQKELATSTVLTYVSAISYLLKLGGYNDVPQHFIVIKTLRGYPKIQKN
ncbi:uncharacterized protein LOC134255648 [Saccostrea cucullata]|uniref:uncharacterized protein LOC134255648 n=1 Tax=Saccostrea cuccullata TaxID=36930 RepID=UPI002ECFEB4A